MNPSRAEALFALAVEKPAAKRAAFLESECSGNASLDEQWHEWIMAYFSCARPKQ